MAGVTRRVPHSRRLCVICAAAAILGAGAPSALADDGTGTTTVTTTTTPAPETSTTTTTETTSGSAADWSTSAPDRQPKQAPAPAAATRWTPRPSGDVNSRPSSSTSSPPAGAKTHAKAKRHHRVHRKRHVTTGNRPAVQTPAQTPARAVRTSAVPRTPAHGSSSKALLAGIAAAALGFVIVPGWFVRRRRGIRVARSPGALGLRKRRNLPEREAILIPKTTAPPEAEETPKLRRVTEPAVAQLRDAVVARSEPPRRREWPKLHAAETAASQPAPAIALAPEPEPVEVEPEPVDETMPVLPQPLPTQLVETPWVAEPPAYLPDEPAAEELVEIAFWRGYRKSAFYARTFDEDGFEVALAESAAFRASGNGVPDQTEEAVRAYEEFVDALVADGWTPVESARPAAWFAQTFERR